MTGLYTITYDTRLLVNGEIESGRTQILVEAEEIRDALQEIPEIISTSGFAGVQVTIESVPDAVDKSPDAARWSPDNGW